MNKQVKVAIIVVVAIFGLMIIKNAFFQVAIGTALSKASHVPVRIGSTNVSLLSSSINLKNIKFLNPRHFPERLMMKIQQVFINFEPASLFRGQAHFEEVRLSVQEIIVIKNREGVVNVEAMKPKEGTGKKGAAPKEGKEMKIKIDKLYLTIGRVVYKDYSVGPTPKVEVFEIGLQNREYRNIENPTALVNLIMFEALTHTTLGRLANLDLGEFKQGFLGQLEGGPGAVEETARGILSLFK